MGISNSNGLHVLFLNMLHSVYASFYVDSLVRSNLPTTSKVSAGVLSFVLCQAVYAVWHGINRLVVGRFWERRFGYVRRRLSRFSVSGPLLLLSFVFLWIPFRVPWLNPVLHFIVLMAVYDGFFSSCCSSLGTSRIDQNVLPEMTTAIYHIWGFLGIGTASYLYEGAVWAAGDNGLCSFRLFTIMWAIVAGVGLLLLSRRSRLHEGKRKVCTHDDVWSHAGDLTTEEFVVFMKQTMLRRSMKAVTLVWALQDYNSALGTQYFAILLAVVCGGHLSAAVRSLVLLFTFVAPHVVPAAVFLMCGSVGKRRTMIWFLSARCVVGVLLCILSIRFYRRETKSSEDTTAAHSSITFAVLWFLNRVLTDTVGQMQALVLSDVIDEDTILFGRQQPMAAAMGSVVSLSSKPSMTLASIFTVVCLWGSGVLRPDPYMNTYSASAIGTVVLFVGLSVTVTAVAMLVPWVHYYNLDGKHLRFINMAMRKRREDKEAEFV